MPVLPPAAKELAQGDEEEPPVTGGGSVAGEQEGNGRESEGVTAVLAAKHDELSPIPSRASSSSAASSPAAGSGQP